MKKGARQSGRDTGQSSVPPASGARLERPAEAEVSTARSRVIDDVPALWLDQLLVAVLDLPVASGPRAVLDSMLDSLASMLRTYAVGACLVRDVDRGGSTILRRTPARMHGRVAGTDPARVFPGLEHEFVIPIPGPDGSTLHLGSCDADMDPEGPPAARLLERAAMALGRVLPAARAATGSRKSDLPPLDQRMVRADKLATFGQVAAGVVHELNNPLTSIVAYSDYLIRKADAGGRDPDDVERLRRIGEAANRMLRFTRELVNYVRPSIGVASPASIGGIIDRAIAFCEHVLAAANVRVEREYTSEPTIVNAISEQLVQVFVNLITNASQAAPASGGRLVVRTLLRPASRSTGLISVVVEVEDNGSGIAEEHLSQVFAPFFTTKTENNGTGLGLSIVKGIIESHEGDIHVESELGRGTRFVIELAALR